MAMTTQPRYVPGGYAGCGPRVTLTRELPSGPHERYAYFIGEHDGTPIRYHCLEVESLVAIRRGIAECGAVTHDATSAWLELATPENLITGPLKIAPGVVRMRPGQLFWWEHDPIWRKGPETPDGFWMVSSLLKVEAVRVIEDEEAPERSAEGFRYALADALVADVTAAQDAYLTALTTAAEIPPAELVRLRDAVRAGKAGGPVDGRRRRRGAVDPLA
jgi:hypothetical protein